MSNMTMTKQLKLMERKDITVHGFRSTFKDWATECTDHDNLISESALAHVTGDETERAYRRGNALEKRRKLMKDWETYCDTGR